MVEGEFIAVDWGSTNFRAQLINENGEVVDEFSEPSGVTRIDRIGMIEVMSRMMRRWPGCDLVLCSGMIGSTVGWVEAPYVDCPTKLEALGGNLTVARIGDVNCRIVPGLACVAPAGGPDVMRGEETEILGLSLLYEHLNASEAIVVLPGTHTKWVRLRNGTVESFFTTMTGEIYDRVSESGLLASVISDEAYPGAVFAQGVTQGVTQGAGLARLLFGVRARVVRGLTAPGDAASYARGVLIGAELADAISAYPLLTSQARTIIIGNQKLCDLYAAAMKQQGLTVEIADKARASAAGYFLLYQQSAV